MVDKDVLKLDVIIDPQYITTGIYNILKKVRPQWAIQEIQIQNVTENNTHSIVFCQLKTDTRSKDAIDIKIFTVQKNVFHKELEGYLSTSRVNVGQPLLATFTNGVVYKHSPGRTLTSQDLNNPNIIRMICESMVKLNELKRCPPKSTFVSKNAASAIVQLEDVIRNIPNTLDDPEENERFQVLPSKEWLSSELHKMKERLDTTVPSCLCHNDLHLRNIVYHPNTDTLSFLNNDLVGLNPEGSDIVRLFALGPVWKMLGIENSNHDFEEGNLLPFARAYIKAKYQSLGLNPDDVSDKEIKTLMWYMQLFWTFHDFIFVIYAMSQIKPSGQYLLAKRSGWLSPLVLSLHFYGRIVSKRDFFFNSKPPSS